MEKIINFVLKKSVRFFSMSRSRWMKLGCILVIALDVFIQPWIAIPRFSTEDIAYYRDLPQKIYLIVIVNGEPDIRSDSQNLVVEAQQIFLPQNLTDSKIAGSDKSQSDRPVHGKIMIKADRYPQFFYGDELDVVCKLQTPPVFDTFSYAAYLAESDIFVYCTKAGIKKLGAFPIVPNRQNLGFIENGAVGANSMAPATPSSPSISASANPAIHSDFLTIIWRNFWVGIFTLKSLTIARINELFAEPQASLVAGILIGQRRSIPQTILNDFNTAGLTHVLAISGYNVSMMIAVFGYLCKNGARRWRYAGMFLGVMVLVVFTGFSSSVLRAAWMGCIALFAQAVGRKGSALHLLLVSAAIMVLFSPRMILVDLSFQLSFLSTLGILLIMPKIEAWEQKLLSNSASTSFSKFPETSISDSSSNQSSSAKKRLDFSWLNKIPAFVREGFYVTLAAQVFTTPLLFYQFGRFSLIAPVANIFVLPLVPWIMFFSFFALIISVVFLPLGQLVSFIAYALVSIMLFLVHFFASLPFAAFQF